MKKLPTYIVSLSLLGILIFAPAATTASDCGKVTGTGNTFAIGPTTFEGTATLNMNDQSVSSTVITNLLGAPKTGDDGTLHVETSHHFSFADGSSFTTLDKAVLSPTATPGVYDLNSRLEIVQGTGNFETACGRLSGHGTLNFITGEAQWWATGRICDCG